MAKGEMYEYEGKLHILTGEYFNDYVEETGVDINKLYTIEESDYIINKYVASCYRGIFHCQEPFIGADICEVLSDVKEKLFIRIDVMCEENGEE